MSEGEAAAGIETNVQGHMCKHADLTLACPAFRPKREPLLREQGDQGSHLDRPRIGGSQDA